MIKKKNQQHSSLSDATFKRIMLDMLYRTEKGQKDINDPQDIRQKTIDRATFNPQNSRV